jgi:hypothetical protein
MIKRYDIRPRRKRQAGEPADQPAPDRRDVAAVVEAPLTPTLTDEK